MTQPIKIISLKNQKEFDAVNKAGKKIYTKHFIIIVARITSSRDSPSERRDLVCANEEPEQVHVILRERERLSGPQKVDNGLELAPHILLQDDDHLQFPQDNEKPLSQDPDAYVHKLKITVDDKVQNPSYVFLGLKVGRKIGNAVTRNKVKRWFREIVRKLTQEQPKFIGSAFIFIPKKSITSNTYTELLGEITLHMKQVK